MGGPLAEFDEHEHERHLDQYSYDGRKGRAVAEGKN